MRMLLSLVLVSAALTYTAIGQVFTIDQFDALRADTLYTTLVGGGNSYIHVSTDQTDKILGTASVRVRSMLDSLYPWGTFSQFGIAQKTGDVPWDFSSSDTLSLWVKVQMTPRYPGYMSFRVELFDQPNPTDNREMYIYQNDNVLDNASGWVNIKVPLVERTSTGSEVPDSTGLILIPTGWGGSYNNKKLDRNKITEWLLVLVTTPTATAPAPGTGNINRDSIEVSFDSFTRTGYRPTPFVYFTGKDYDASHAPGSGKFLWGGATMDVVQGAGPTSSLNAIKWTQGDAWSGGGHNLSPSVNLSGAWPVDSLKFMMKADVGTAALRAQFEASAGKRGSVFTPLQDGLWHQYALALRDFIDEGSGVPFDSSAITVFQFMNENSGIAGKLIWMTNIWTGNPTIDVIPPDAVTGLNVASSTYSNVIAWNSVTNKPNVTYNVFAADHAWTDPSDSTVGDVPLYNIPNLQATHLLRAPNTDRDLTYYYGVQAKDGSGNLSSVSLATPITTLAQGVPTIAKAPPASFAADGDLSEWAGFTPFSLSATSGTAHVNENGVIDNDADCSAKAYLAVDANNLYVAFDVTDDVVKVDTTGVTGPDYEQDAPDLFIGLYDWRGKAHGGLPGGVTPDYHVRFSLNRVRLDGLNVNLMYAYPDGVNPNPNYAWVQKLVGSGYTIEAKIPFTLFANASATRHDVLFDPKEGMRIPIDFEINDRDNKTAADYRDGMLCYAPLNNDNSYQDMWRWTYTWIGNLMNPVTSVKQVSAVPVKYALLQNYPNPFNPSTVIKYNIEKAGQVHLKIYDLLGREVATLVDDNQTVGTYTVTFNAAGQNFSSGVYFYRLESGSFVATHKLMLLK